MIKSTSIESTVSPTDVIDRTIISPLDNLQSLLAADRFIGVLTPMRWINGDFPPAWFKGQLFLGAIALAIFGLYLLVKWLLE